jgi:hemoglobin
MTEPEPGLCGGCRWARAVVSARGSRFLRCGRADDDPAFARYPALPVRTCAGFEAERGAISTPPPRPAATRDDSAAAIPLIERPPPRQVAAPPPEADTTLLERIGGRATVERLVSEFYDRVERDPDLRPLFPAELGPGREKQALFMEQWLGGEPRYSERYGHPRLRRRHFPFVIDAHAAGRWLHHMAEALVAAEIAEPERAEILRGLGPLAHHMTNAGEDVPRAPLADERLT